MNKLTDTFINNAGKSNQKSVVEYSAFTGNQGKSKHELDVNREEIYLIIAAICVIGFITWLNLGG